jgi:hypothetical protein
VASLAGDFNQDNVVNAADYVVWRKGGGLQTEYDSWRLNFGRSAAGSGASLDGNNAVPEPTSITMLALGLAALCCRRRSA